MPGSFIGELLLRPILELLFETLFYCAGRVVVSLLSFGQLKCDRILADTPKQKLRGGGLYHRRGKQIYLTVVGTSLVGMFSLGLIGAALFFIWRSTKAE